MCIEMLLSSLQEYTFLSLDINLERILFKILWKFMNLQNFQQLQFNLFYKYLFLKNSAFDRNIVSLCFLILDFVIFH